MIRPMMHRILVLLIVPVMIISGCDSNNEGFSLEPRIALETGGIYFSARVFLEGPEGQAVTGAIVYVVSPSNAVTLLEYDYTRGCFAGTPGTPQNGVYSFVVDSRAYGITERQVPFSTLDGSPSITAFSGSDGANVLSGSSIAAGTSASIDWNGVAGATVYRIELEKVSGTVIQYSTESTTLLLGPEVFSNTGNYAVSVTAQYIAGDPLFRDDDFYAANQKEGSTLYFEVE